MIKKFNNFIKENVELHKRYVSYNMKLSDILSMEDVEDQFLRLKEVFGLDIEISYCKNTISHQYDTYLIIIENIKKEDVDEKFNMELETIKRRIEDIFKQVAISIAYTYVNRYLIRIFKR